MDSFLLLPALLTKPPSPPLPCSTTLRPLSSSCIRRRSPSVVASHFQRTNSDTDDGTGDEKLQQVLVDMVRLQTRKAHVSDFVATRFERLQGIAQQAESEYDRIVQNTMRGIDAASMKVMKNLEQDAQVIEEELASARAKMEANEQEFNEFEKKVAHARSEGLFFQSLYKPMKRYKAVQQQQAIKNEPNLISEITRRSLGSRFRRVMYSILVFLLSLTLLEDVGSGELSWPKFTLYGGLLLILLLQLSYEKLVSSSENQLKRK